MRLLIDYRAALRQPSGVGEYARQLVSGLLALKRETALPLDVTIFSSSWKDRLALPEGMNGVTVIDQRIPVSLLNFTWHRFGWPVVEALTDGLYDVVHSLHPLLLPSRWAAQVITIHDLYFLAHPERTRAEIRRDYAPLAQVHAERADCIVVPSHFTAREVERHFRIGADRIVICPPSAPPWRPRSAAPGDGCILFVGTLEPRKNVGTLLDAYARLADRTPSGGAGAIRPLPELVLAGAAQPEASTWLDRLKHPPLVGRVRHIGYVDPSKRRQIYEGALMLVQPSFEEGFGLPALEAMAAGVPVVAANRGAAPEVVGEAGLLVDPEDPVQMAAAISRLLDEPGLAAACTKAGVARAARFGPSAMAERALKAYGLAIDAHARRSPLI